MIMKLHYIIIGILILILSGCQMAEETNVEEVEKEEQAGNLRSIGGVGL